MFGSPRRYGLKPTDGWTANFERGLWKVLGGAKKCTSRAATDELNSGNIFVLIGLRGSPTRLCSLLRRALFLRLRRFFTAFSTVFSAGPVKSADRPLE